MGRQTGRQGGRRLRLRESEEVGHDPERCGRYRKR
jgi:hypothetical protein